MENLKVIHYDLDGVLWIPGNFLENTLPLCIEKGMENGLDIENKQEGLELINQIRKAKGSNAQNHFDILVDICNGQQRELKAQLKDSTDATNIINETYPQYFNMKISSLGDQNYIMIQSMVCQYKNSKTSIMKPTLGAADVLDECLRRNYILTIISNGYWSKQTDKLDELNLSHYFRHRQTEPDIKILDSLTQISDEVKSKEKPNPYLWQQQRKKIEKYFGTYYQDREVHIGDKYMADIYGANSLGIFTVKINQGSHADETIEDALRKMNIPTIHEKNAFELLQPDVTIDRLTKLPSALSAIEKDYAGLLEKKHYQKHLGEKPTEI